MSLPEFVSTIAPIAASEYEHISQLDRFAFDDHRLRARSRFGSFPSIENLYLACINEAYALVRPEDPTTELFESYIDLAVLAGRMRTDLPGDES